MMPWFKLLAVGVVVIIIMGFIDFLLWVNW